MATGTPRNGKAGFAIIFATLTSMLALPAWSFDTSGQGTFRLILSPQFCHGRTLLEDSWIKRSGSSVITNVRSTSIRLACPLLRTFFTDNEGECDQGVRIQTYIRLRPKTSRKEAVVKFSMLRAIGDDYQPQGYKSIGRLKVSDAGWDGSSNWTPVNVIRTGLDCIQLTNANESIDIDEEAFVPAINVTLPPGAQLTAFYYLGG